MKRFILLLPMLYGLAIGAEVEFTPAEEKAAQIIAVEDKALADKLDAKRKAAAAVVLEKDKNVLSQL